MEKNNPMGLDGFEFVEFSSPDPQALKKLFESLSFTPIAKHRSKEIILYRQGHINFLVNETPDSHAQQFAKDHGPCACGMAFRVKNAKKAFELAVSQGAQPFRESNIPAIYGIGDSLLYFIDYPIYDTEFTWFPGASSSPQGKGLGVIDHLTHNVHRGQMKLWADFYKDIFHFFEIRYFDIEGQKTGLTSFALSSPCGKIKIPLNESKDDKSQIEEFLQAYKGEGIQHIALSTDNIYETIEALSAQNVRFLTVPDTYYEAVHERVKGHHEDLVRMRKNQILIDGNVTGSKENLLLQIFTENAIGPIFFEIIQRKGNEGFGHGNFQALFEAIERDQIRRGVL